jgi:hypothetical protein
MGDADTSVVATATFAVLFAYLRQARDQGDITAEEMSRLLDYSLTALEMMGTAPMIDGARLLLEDTFRVLLAPSQPESPASERRPARRPKRRKP